MKKDYFRERALELLLLIKDQDDSNALETVFSYLVEAYTKGFEAAKNVQRLLPDD